jgi:hypothetical protein
LTTIFGIENDEEMSRFLRAASRLNNMLPPTENENAYHNKKSMEKAVKVLGIDDKKDTLYFDRLMHPSGSRTFIANSSRGRMNKLYFGRRSFQQSVTGHGGMMGSPSTILEGNVVDFVPMQKPVVTDGKFMAKFHLVNQTYKSVFLAVDATVQEVTQLLIEKFSIKEDHGAYGIFEEKRSSGKEILYTTVLDFIENLERVLLPTEVVFDIICHLEEKDILVFKRKVNLEPSSMESLAVSNQHLDKERKRTKRAAQLSRILGVQEFNRAEDDVEASLEIESIKTMLHSMSKGLVVEGLMEQNIEEERIFKEGWLRKEEAGFGKNGKNYWCYIENGTFHAVPKGDVADATGHYKIAIDHCNVQLSTKNPCIFEIFLKSDPKLTHIFCAESASTCEAWVSAIKNNKKAITKDLEIRKMEKITMNDFEIHRVLGRGKFGKVMSQIPILYEASILRLNQ